MYYITWDVEKPSNKGTEFKQTFFNEEGQVKKDPRFWKFPNDDDDTNENGDGDDSDDGW